MATGHWPTNRGRLLITQGRWDTAAATLLRVGLLSVSQPVNADTAAKVADFNTVADLVAAGATICTATNYVAKNLARSNATEDDTNDRVNMDAADVVWTALGGATNNTLYGAYIYDAGTDTSDTTRLLMSVDWFVTPLATNGGDVTYAIADLYRAA